MKNKQEAKKCQVGDFLAVGLAAAAPPAEAPSEIVGDLIHHFDSMVFYIVVKEKKGTLACRLRGAFINDIFTVMKLC